MQEIQKERVRTARIVVVINKHLKQASVWKLEAGLCQAAEGLAEEEQNDANKKTNETTVTKAKAAWQRETKTEAVARAAIKKGEVEHYQQNREEQAADQAAVQHMDKQAATKMKSVDKVHIVAKQKTGNTMQGSCRSSKMSSPPNYGR